MTPLEFAMIAGGIFGLFALAKGIAYVTARLAPGDIHKKSPKSKLTKQAIGENEPFEMRYTLPKAMETRLFIRYHMDTQFVSGMAGGKGFIVDYKLEVEGQKRKRARVGWAKESAVPGPVDREETSAFNASGSGGRKKGTMYIDHLGEHPVGTELVITGTLTLNEYTKMIRAELFLSK